jgi:hypothetical protein
MPWVAAFCFYNVSSIVNGLVYFNQFSLIPPLHLGLVSIGIFVLLCGVWVVSIQPGSGGGVDIRPWTEEGLNLSGEDLAIYSETEVGGGETAQPMMVPHPTVGSPKMPQFGPVVMERETRSESNIPNISPPSSPIGLGLDLGPEAANRLTQSFIFPMGKRKGAETQLYPGPRTPSIRRPTYDISSHLAHSRNMTYPHPHPSLMPSSPSIGTVSTLGSGFQIGLSPLSPGFTILPLERRRRPSGMQASFVDVGSEVVESVRERRRTVSEGEGSTRVACGGHVTDAEASINEANSNADTVDNAEPSMLGEGVQLQGSDNGVSGNGKQRWRWLREIFMTRD